MRTTEVDVFLSLLLNPVVGSVAPLLSYVGYRDIQYFCSHSNPVLCL